MKIPGSPPPVRSANDNLTDLRALLHGGPCEAAWGGLCRTLDAIDDPDTLQIALDLCLGLLPRNAAAWRQPAQIVPASWLACRADNQRDPRLTVLDALGIERALYALLPPGRFLMGSPEEEAGRKADEVQTEVVLSRGLAIGVFPATHAQWTQIMGTCPSYFQGVDPDLMAQRPVENVTWFSAVAFCNAMSAHWGLEPFYRRSDGGAYGSEEAQAQATPTLGSREGSGWRLPTEAEWEYACRAGTTTATYAGDPMRLGERDATLLDTIAWYRDNSDTEKDGGLSASGSSDVPDGARRPRTHPVGLKKANGYGLHDMFGNVFEWCWDWHGDYPDRSQEIPRVDPEGPDHGQARVFRGGCWNSNPSGLRAAHRGHITPTARAGVIGLRLVRSVHPPSDR